MGASHFLGGDNSHKKNLPLEQDSPSSQVRHTRGWENADGTAAGIKEHARAHHEEKGMKFYKVYYVNEDL